MKAEKRTCGLLRSTSTEEVGSEESPQGEEKTNGDPPDDQGGGDELSEKVTDGIKDADVKNDNEPSNEKKEENEDNADIVTTADQLLASFAVTQEEALRLFYDLKQRDDNLRPTPEWLRMRRYRLTSSRFFMAVIEDKELLSIMATWPLPEAAPGNETKYGIQNEGRAREAYEEMTKSKVREVGVLISPDVPWLAASPDGVVDDNGTLGLLEIKTSSHVRRGGLVELMKKRPHIKAQIMGSLRLIRDVVPGITWCDLFLWSPRFHEVLRITYDEEYWQKLYRKLHRFYFNSFLNLWAGWTDIKKRLNRSSLLFTSYLHQRQYRQHRTRIRDAADASYTSETADSTDDQDGSSGGHDEGKTDDTDGDAAEGRTDDER